MNAISCLTCIHCDTSRKNDLGEVRCKRFSTFVNVLHKCDFHSSGTIQELAEKLKRSERNADR